MPNLIQNIFQALKLNRYDILLKPIVNTTNITSKRTYAAKKPPALTEQQIQFQKRTAELGFREKTSIRGTKFEIHSVEISIKYMQSEAFKKAYEDKFLWEWYIRNFKGQKPKSYTRKQCIISDTYTTGNPCPICRDPYLVVSYKNIQLLKHFVSPYTGYLLPTMKTNVCRRQQENLEIAFEIACDYGLIEHNIPHRQYNYSNYFSTEDLSQLSHVEGIKLGVDIDKTETAEKASVLLGLVLGSNRKQINDVYNNLQENDLVTN